MGGCVSKSGSDESPYMGTAMDTNPFSTLFELHKGVCRVGQAQGSGLGFICHFPLQTDPAQKVYGLVTTNYVLGVPELSSSQISLTFDSYVAGERKSFEINIKPQERFRFSCPVLDATFLHLTPGEVSYLKSRKRLFLELTTDWEASRNEELLVVEQQTGFKAKFTRGAFMRYHGCDILHTSSSDIGSWGSPLALKDGKVIGLHKKKSSGNTAKYDIALSTKALVRALQKFCRTHQPTAQLVSNPVRFNPESELRVVEHGLAKCASLENKTLVFVSPAADTSESDTELDDEGFVRHVPPQPSQGPAAEVQTLDTSKHVSPVWFVPTSHGWYWTPTDPFDRSQETNWMPINTRYAIGPAGQYGKALLKKDVEIAKWLKSIGGIQGN